MKDEWVGGGGGGRGMEVLREELKGRRGPRRRRRTDGNLG